MFTITDKDLAEVIGKEPGFDNKLFWLPEELPRIQIALRAILRLNRTNEPFLVDSQTFPHWLYLAITSELAGKALFLNDLELGHIQIPDLAPQPAARGLTWRVAEESTFTLVEFSIGRRLKPEDLEVLVPPTVSSDRGVVIAGNAPPWITASIGLAYSKSAPWIACTQKAGNATVAVSKDKSIPAGSNIDRHKLVAAHERTELRTVPRRGEIWWFEDGYDPHPGLIISPTAANERLTHVLLVPLTSTPWKGAESVMVLSTAATGLFKDSFALCEHVSKIQKRRLQSGPVGTITDELLMAALIRQVRQALGDAMVA
jgi:CRISPR-associated Csx3 family protein